MHNVKQAIVVEGKYDKNTLAQIVDCPIFQTDGFHAMHDKELLALLRLAARKRGLVILTDSDAAGFVIRNSLKNALQGENILHAYIPDISGKEKRKTAPGKEGKLGVEGMKPEVLLTALKNAGAEVDGEACEKNAEPITKADLYAVGLSGRADCAERRRKLQNELALPAHLSANGFLQALNLLWTKMEFFSYFEQKK